ncbi:MAG: hypothetical protein ACYDAA_11210 [Syntrophales bacterium]
MKKFFGAMIIGVVFLMVPVFAIGATLTGSIQGFNCVTQGKVCPVGQEDPVIAAENVFVLLVDAAKGKYYFVPNVDRGIMARHINQEVKIEGKVNETMKSIHAEKIFVGGKEVWSANLASKIYNDILGAPPASNPAAR